MATEQIIVEQWLYNYSDSFCRGKWYVAGKRGTHKIDDKVYDDFVYLWPDGSWRKRAMNNENDHAYYNTREDAEAVLAKIKEKP